MALRRGFKTEANSTAEDIRRELGLRPLDPLDPRRLAELLEIPIWSLSELAQDKEAVLHLVEVEPEAFSAATVFRGPARVIVHNDGHAPVRQNSNLAHELAHGLLLHPPTPAMDNTGCRQWNQDIEDEASWLASVLLVSEAATIDVVRRGTPRRVAAEYYGVSTQMLQFRINATGAVRRVQRMKRVS